MADDGMMSAVSTCQFLSTFSAEEKEKTWSAYKDNLLKNNMITKAQASTWKMPKCLK
jgi:hypothetical protein